MFFAPGHWELIVVIIVALLIFGTRLPAIARSAGKSIQSFRKRLLIYSVISRHKAMRMQSIFWRT